MVYELTGVYPAEHFFRIDNRTGAVYLTQSLRNDNLQTTEYAVSILHVNMETFKCPIEGSTFDVGMYILFFFSL